MNTSALLIMLTTVLFVTGFTLYFFWKVLHTPPRPEADADVENKAFDDTSHLTS